MRHRCVTFKLRDVNAPTSKVLCSQQLLDANVAIVAVVVIVTVMAVLVFVAPWPSCRCADCRGITLCRLPYGIALCNRIVRIASRSAQLSMGLRCADKRRNFAKEEGLIVRNGNYLCALLYEREGLLYQKPTFSYMNSRNSSVEFPRRIRVDCKHIAIPIVGKPVSSTVTAN